MANVDAAFGFRPIGENGSGVNTGGTTLYTISDNYATSIYKGDHVMSSGGYVIAGTASGATNLGIFNGCFYIDPTSKKPTWSNYYSQVNVTDTGSISGSTNIDAYIYDDPMRIFEVQSVGTIAKTSIGRNADTVLGTASTVNGQSVTEIESDSGSATAVATTAALQFKIIGISKDPDNSDASSANANWYVRWNEHLYFSSTGITGT